MTHKQISKLQDYLAGILNLTNTTNFQIGSILYDKKSALEVKKELKANKVSIVNPEKRHPDLVLADIIEPLKKGQYIALELIENLPGKILNELHNIAHNQVNIKLAPENKEIVFKPKDKGGKLIFLVNRDKLNYLPLQPLISSACNLK